MRTKLTICALLCFMVASAHCQSKPPAYYCVKHLLTLATTVEKIVIKNQFDVLLNLDKLKDIGLNALNAFKTCEEAVKKIILRQTETLLPANEPQTKVSSLGANEPNLIKLTSSQCQAKMVESYEKLSSVKGCILGFDFADLLKLAFNKVQDMIKALMRVGIDHSGLKSACL